MARVLVTGGAGFLGSHVGRSLVEEGHSVVVLDDLSGGYEENVPLGADFCLGSILDPSLLEALFKQHRFEVVFHLAAYAAEGLSHFARAFNYLNNVVGSAHLISLAARYGCRKFVFTSSIAVYGSNQLPMTEDLIPRPEDPYGIAKYAVEQDLKAFHELFGVDYVIFRPHNVYGENQNIGDPFRNVVGIFMRQILCGEKLSIFGDGSQTRAFSYVGDIAPVIARSAWEPKAANQIFNIGADKPYTINELARWVTQVMGAKPDIVHLPPRLEVHDAYAEHHRVRQVFGDFPLTPIEEGLARMAQWVKKTGLRQSRQLPAVEIWKNLPPTWKKVLLETGQTENQPLRI